MSDAGLRARVERLLKGDRRTDDVTRLFLYARDRCDGREPVQEIGDFVAHHDERTKGIVTNETRDWYRTIGFVVPRIGKEIDGSKLPGDFPEFLLAAFRRTPMKHIRDAAKLRYADARKMLPLISRKLRQNHDGTLALTNEHTSAELALVGALCGNITARPAFDDERLFADFCATLKSHALLKKDEMQDFHSVKPFMALFAVSVMHNCVVCLDDGRKVTLKAGIHGDTITIDAAVPVALPVTGSGGVKFSSSIFATGLNPIAHCHFDLLALSTPWEAYIEVVASDILLAPLV